MPKTTAFRSALEVCTLTPAQILDFHRATFGDLRMEDTGGDAGANGADGADGGQPNDQGDAGAGDGRGPGTDAGKPISEMTDAEKAAYFEKKANRYQNSLKERRDYAEIKAERDKLKAAGQTDAEKAIEAAKREAATAAATDTASKYQARLVQAELKAELKGRIPDDQIAGHVEFLDTTKFLAADGEVDTDKVQQYAAGLVPAGAHRPDMGQGRRGGSTPAKGVSAGADLFAASRGKKTT